MAFHDDNFQVWKKPLLTKILSSFAFKAQLHQNIGNRRDQQINDYKENLIDVWNWFLRCTNEIQVSSEIEIDTRALSSIIRQ